METILIMCAGVAVGATVFPAGLKKWNGRLQLLLTGLLIFTMGVRRRSRPGFVALLVSLGLVLRVVSLVPVLLSVAVVWPLSRRFLEKRREE